LVKLCHPQRLAPTWRSTATSVPTHAWQHAHIPPASNPFSVPARASTPSRCGLARPHCTGRLPDCANSPSPPLPPQLLFGGAIHEAGEVKARANRRSATSDWMELEKVGGQPPLTAVGSWRLVVERLAVGGGEVVCGVRPCQASRGQTTSFKSRRSVVAGMRRLVQTGGQGLSTRSERRGGARHMHVSGHACCSGSNIASPASSAHQARGISITSTAMTFSYSDMQVRRGRAAAAALVATSLRLQERRRHWG
jgi:hypothetical protein